MSKRKSKISARHQEKIEELRKILNELLKSEKATEIENVLSKFGDRFDEVLNAILNSEKRIDGGSKC